MKRIIALALILAAPVTMADECRSTYRLAEQIMTNRQDGIDLMTMMDVTQKGPEQGREEVAILVREAYRMPQYNHEPFRSRTIKDFAERVYLICAR